MSGSLHERKIQGGRTEEPCWTRDEDIASVILRKTKKEGKLLTMHHRSVAKEWTQDACEWTRRLYHKKPWQFGRGAVPPPRTAIPLLVAVFAAAFCILFFYESLSRRFLINALDVFYGFIQVCQQVNTKLRILLHQR